MRSPSVDSPDARRLLVAALAVATVATAGSLYYSHVLGLYPCRPCWYQRILMYPLVPVVGYAVLADEPGLARLGLAFTVPGGALAAYHSSLQLSTASTCSFVGCGTVQFRLFGVLTIPNQSLVAFALLTALFAVVARR